MTAGLIFPEEADAFSDLLAAAQMATFEEGASKRSLLERIAARRARVRLRHAEAIVQRAQYAQDVLSVVYFVRMGDHIKIGTTFNLKSRVSQLSLTMDHVLATEPGNSQREGELHQQFASLREHGEWFRAEEPLLSYIDDIKSRAEARRNPGARR